jgi:hypothetical protein
MRQIWESSAGLREVREQTKRAKRTVDGQGEAGRRMSFCAGLAIAHHGDPTALYDDAREQAELVGRALAPADEGSRPDVEERQRELLPVLG